MEGNRKGREGERKEGGRGREEEREEGKGVGGSVSHTYWGLHVTVPRYIYGSHGTLVHFAFYIFWGPLGSHNI